VLASDLAQIIEQYHHALDAFMRGDAEPLKALYSRRDDAILANPFGPPVHGWDQVVLTMERAASHYREGVTSGRPLRTIGGRGGRESARRTSPRGVGSSGSPRARVTQ
jgi:hypothetical protein